MKLIRALCSWNDVFAELEMQLYSVCIHRNQVNGWNITCSLNLMSYWEIREYNKRTIYGDAVDKLDEKYRNESKI